MISRDTAYIIMCLVVGWFIMGLLRGCSLGEIFQQFIFGVGAIAIFIIFCFVYESFKRGGDK